MLPQVHLVSDIHTQISGHQSTANIQPITVDINGKDSDITVLSIVNLRHVSEYTFHELRPDFNNHSKFQCSTHCIFDLCSFY